MDSVLTENELKSIVNTLNVKWRSEMCCAPYYGMLANVCMLAGLILFALLPLTWSTRENGFPWDLPVGVTLFVFGVVGSNLASKPRERAILRARSAIANYCNELSQQFKSQDIYFSVINSPFADATETRQIGMPKIPRPTVVVRYIRQQVQVVAVAPVAATVAQPLNVAPINVGAPTSAPAPNIPIGAVAVSILPSVDAPSNAEQQLQQNIDALYRQGVLDEKTYQVARERLMQ